MKGDTHLFFAYPYGLHGAPKGACATHTQNLSPHSLFHRDCIFMSRDLLLGFEFLFFIIIVEISSVVLLLYYF